jgi:energy-coupling factor transporter ATP-binding protein EcfA2
MMSSLDLSGRPLADTKRDRALFVDQAETLQLIRTTVLHSGNVVVFGSRGSGKSSLLRFLKHLLETEDERQVVLVQGRVATSTIEFLRLLRDRLNAWSQVRVSDAAGAVAAGVGSFLADPRFALRPTQTDTQTLLDELHDFRASLPDEEMIVLVDEMPSPEATRTLFGRLRDELWELPLTWCVAADERDRSSFTEPPADAFWRRLIDLEPLSPEQSKQLLRRRLGPNEANGAALDQIIHEAEGNPRRLLNLAHEMLVEGRPSDEIIEEQRRRQQRVERLSEPERRLLAELEAGGGASPSDEGLLKKLGWSRSRASQVFGELEKQGFVRASSQPGTHSRPRRFYELTD